MSRARLADLRFASCWIASFDGDDGDTTDTEANATRDRLVAWLEDEIARREIKTIVLAASKKLGVKPVEIRHGMARRAARQRTAP